MRELPLQHAPILIVDDQEANVLVLQAMLEQAGYRNLHSLTDPRQVVPYCTTHRPDLILLDVHMPQMDGFSVMERLQALFRAEEYPPILVLTADITLEAKRRALAVGAKDFVTKPFDRPEVLLRVKNLLHTRFLYRQSQDQKHVLAVQLHDRARDLARAEAARQDIAGEMEHQAHHDALTGLPNRLLLHDRLEAAVAAAQRDEASLALLLLDLDRFKDINGTLGHHTGDLLLREVAVRLRRLVQASDTVARLGGDEFAVLIPGARAVAATWAARKILSAFAQPCVVAGQGLPSEVSIGLVLYPDHGADASSLLRHAEVAMYAAKEAASGYAVYAAAHDPYSMSRLLLMKDLQAAIAHNQLTLDYQPKVHLATRRTCGVEALVRWSHPHLGQVAPDHFIALAEHSGVIVALTWRVLEAALAQCQAWQHRGLPLDVAVNLSMRTLHDTQFPATLAALLRRYDVAAERVTLELTESALMLDRERVEVVLTQLAGLGLRLSIDDFGTGYSSLSYLSRLPVQEVKIDRSFVLAMLHSASDAAIVRSVIDLGHDLGVQVVAEGVEQRGQWQVLNEWGCDVIQGYHLSRPLGATDLTEWVLTSAYGLARGAA